MKILFVDFDGVLHPLSAAEGLNPELSISEVAQQPGMFCWATQLAELLGENDVGIIVHSSWRLMCDDNDLRKLLGPLAPYFLGSTPRAQRFESIQWLVHANQLTDYRILDDMSEAFPTGLPELILCDPEVGVSDERVVDHLVGWLSSTAII
jgi:hypothetical protein